MIEFLPLTFFLPMVENILLAIALVGSSLAAAWDLRTTEIPDKIPSIMVIIAFIIHITKAFLTWSYLSFISSVIVGLGFFGFGFLMYYLGQWGGGDAKLLGAIGFLLPDSKSLNLHLFFPLPLSYMVNVFLIGAIYMLLYAAVLAMRNRKIIKEFKKDIKASSRFIIVSSAALFLAFVLIGFYFTNFYLGNTNVKLILTNSIPPLLLTISFFIIWKFARIVENVGFKKRVSVHELKVGDVLLSSRLWEGITEKELRAIRKSEKKYVWIKEGVRFAPTFPLALLATVLFGDTLLIFIKFFI